MSGLTYFLIHQIALFSVPNFNFLINLIAQVFVYRDGAADEP